MCFFSKIIVKKKNTDSLFSITFKQFENILALVITCLLSMISLDMCNSSNKLVKTFKIFGLSLKLSFTWIIKRFYFSWSYFVLYLHHKVQVKAWIKSREKKLWTQVLDGIKYKELSVQIQRNMTTVVFYGLTIDTWNYG